MAIYSRDRAVTGIAGGQRDLVGTAQLRECGLDKDAVGSGELAPLALEQAALMPETNVPFGRFEADFVWREQKLIVELGSATYHSGPGVFQRDREKGLVFRGAGYDVLRPTRHHVVHDGTRVLVLLAQALVAR